MAEPQGLGGAGMEDGSGGGRRPPPPTHPSGRGSCAGRTVMPASSSPVPFVCPRHHRATSIY
uniref:Uncharacterized protein n=1 Tax=Oryza rufipogon TaxID=4529 RepID=A0A0E0R6H8_ORYRU